MTFELPETTLVLITFNEVSWKEVKCSMRLSLIPFSAAVQ